MIFFFFEKQTGRWLTNIGLRTYAQIFVLNGYCGWKLKIINQTVIMTQLVYFIFYLNQPKKGILTTNSSSSLLTLYFWTRLKNKFLSSSPQI